MALEFLLPDIGEGLAEATIVAWHVPVGAAVGLDEPLVELETDKAVVEMPAPRAGFVLHHGAGPGEVLEVGSVLVVIGADGEVWEPPASTLEVLPGADAPIVGTLEEGRDPGPRPQALPVVRRLAEDLGVDLVTLAGSGPGGRITRSDVEGAAEGTEAGDRVRLSPTRLAIARNLARSWQEIPHVTTFGEADADGLLDERSRLAAAGDHVPLEALLIHRLTPLLARFPEFNATLDGDYLILKRSRDVGFAVDTPDGLMVAVVRGAQGRSVTELAAEVSRLSAATRNRTAAPHELRGATFTVSNIGAVGGRYGTPIVPYGTTAILSVGRAEPLPVVRGGVVAVAREFPLSLSYDHRVIDGSLGRRFLAAVAEAIAIDRSS